MKFAQQLIHFRDPSFRDYYLDYKFLKKKIKDIDLETWLDFLDAEVSKVSGFYWEQFLRTRQRFQELKNIHSSEHGEFMHIHAQNQIAAELIVVRRLFDFLTLNRLAFKKIIKKGKKSFADWPHKVTTANILGDDLDEQLKKHESVQRDMLSCLSPSAVGINEILLMPTSDIWRNARNVWFRNGINLMMLISCLFALLVLPSSLPPELQLPSNDFLLLLKSFRIVSMLIFFLLGAGMAMEAFQKYGVNWRFLLNVCPKVLVKAEDVHRAASWLIFFLLLIMAVAVTDIKFMNVSSRMARIKMYPGILFSFCVVFLLIPSKKIRRRYRRNVASIFFEVLIAPFGGPVLFSHNIIGDILTSLAKPIQDLLWCICYTSSYLIGGVWEIDTLDSGNICGDYTKQLFALATMIPFWIRLMQCISKYRETKVRTHLGNCGKYITGLFMVIVTTIDWIEMGASVYGARLIIVGAYCAATVYMYLWDIHMDWGLIDVEQGTIIPRHTLYPWHYYYGIGAFNTLGRMTWALTLIPLPLDNQMIAEAIFFAVSVIEIARRSLWAMLRVENHHIQKMVEGNIVTSLGARMGDPNIPQRQVLQAPTMHSLVCPSQAVSMHFNRDGNLYLGGQRRTIFAQGTTRIPTLACATIMERQDHDSEGQRVPLLTGVRRSLSCDNLFPGPSGSEERVSSFRGTYSSPMESHEDNRLKCPTVVRFASEEEEGSRSTRGEEKKNE